MIREEAENTAKAINAEEIKVYEKSQEINKNKGISQMWSRKVPKC